MNSADALDILSALEHLCSLAGFVLYAHKTCYEMKKVFPIIITLFSSLALFAQEPVTINNLLISILSLILVLGIGIIAFLVWPKEVPEEADDGLFEEIPEVVVTHETPKPFGIETDLSFTEKIDTIVNDVVLSVYIPHNAVPELTLGVPDRNDSNIIFAAQAADIRKDNRKILGAFVLK